MMDETAKITDYINLARGFYSIQNSFVNMLKSEISSPRVLKFHFSRK